MRQRVDRPSPAEHNGEAGASRGLTLTVEVSGTGNSSRLRDFVAFRQCGSAP